MDNPIVQVIAAIPVLYSILLLVLLVLAMYWARHPFHSCMSALGRIVYSAMRLAAASVKRAESRLHARNRRVLMRAGLDLAERRVEREFERLSTVVRKDLEGYPLVQRKASVNLQKLEDDFEKSIVIPQSLPNWEKVIDAVAKIEPPGDRLVIDMLDKIHHTLEEQHRTALARHREDVALRYAILSKMLPVWRSTQKTLSGVQKTIAQLNQRARKIDGYMDTYQKIRNQDDRAGRLISSSSLTQFFISGLLLGIFIIGAMINFNLVALPLSEMVGGASFIGGFKTSDVAGIFMVSIEILVGFFLMDALRFTHLFSVFGSMDDRKRKFIFWGLVALLTLFAGMESFLAFRRDQIATAMEVLRQTLAGNEAADMATSAIPLVGQMIMGFLLPFILIFLAIPFESFVASTRTVLGMVATWALRMLSFGLRLAGNLGFYIVRMVSNVYDLVIFPALWFEGVICRAVEKKEKEQKSSDERRPSKPIQRDAQLLVQGATPFKKAAEKDG